MTDLIVATDDDGTTHAPLSRTDRYPLRESTSLRHVEHVFAGVHACMAIPDATPALIERVEPNWAIEQTTSQLS